LDGEGPEFGPVGGRERRDAGAKVGRIGGAKGAGPIVPEGELGAGREGRHGRKK